MWFIGHNPLDGYWWFVSSVWNRYTEDSEGSDL